MNKFIYYIYGFNLFKTLVDITLFTLLYIYYDTNVIFYHVAVTVLYLISRLFFKPKFYNFRDMDKIIILNIDQLIFTLLYVTVIVTGTYDYIINYDTLTPTIILMTYYIIITVIIRINIIIYCKLNLKENPYMLV